MNNLKEKIINLILVLIVLIVGIFGMWLMIKNVDIEEKDNNIEIANKLNCYYEMNGLLGEYCKLLGEYEPSERLYNDKCNWYAQEEMWRVNKNTIFDDNVKEKFWRCKIVKDCPAVDWRFNKPDELCEYKYKTIESKENPVILEEYGGYCEELK